MKRWGWWGAVIVWCGVIFGLSSIPDRRTSAAPLTETFSRKGAHLVEYGVLALLVFHALLAGGAARRRALGGAFLFAFLYAASDEIHQSFVPGRYGKVRDVALDVLGAALVLSIYSRRRNTVGPSTDREIPS